MNPDSNSPSSPASNSTSRSLVAPFFLNENETIVETKWREKRLISSEILGVDPTRAMQPEVLGDRVKLDVMHWQGRLGIRNRDNEFFEIQSPDTACPEILEMMETYLARPLPVEKAQLRFRYSQNERYKGLWIDVANEDIKALKDDGTWLRHFIEVEDWIIEAGQKGKAFSIDDDGELVFEEAPYIPWLDSYDINNEKIPLVSTINQFSQPGPEVNRAMIATGFELLYNQIDNIETWAEFGAGYGNLTAAFASLMEGKKAWTCEVQPQAISCLKENAKDYFPRVHQSHTAAKLSWLPERADLWIIDPPRSGFPELFRELMDFPIKRPRFVLCYHCHTKGLLADSSLLKALGYRLFEWSCVDAFPATTHHEVISLWKL